MLIVPYIVAALVVVMLSKGSRVRALLVVVLLGVLFEFSISVGAVKRSLISGRAEVQQVSQEFVSGVDLMARYVRGRAPFLLTGAFGLAILAMFPSALRDEERPKSTEGAPSAADARPGTDAGSG